MSNAGTFTGLQARVQQAGDVGRFARGLQHFGQPAHGDERAGLPGEQIGQHAGRPLTQARPAARSSGAATSTAHTHSLAASRQSYLSDAAKIAPVPTIELRCCCRLVQRRRSKEYPSRGTRETRIRSPKIRQANGGLLRTRGPQPAAHGLGPGAAFDRHWMRTRVIRPILQRTRRPTVELLK
jgi:hypothetical protein